MNLKRFSIFSAVIIGLLIVTLITLSCIRVNNGLSIDEPSKIVLYAKSTVGTTYSMEETPSKYNQAKNAYKEMTNLSVIDYMINGKSLNLDPGQDMDQNYKSWQESNKSNNFCAELIFNDKQSIIVNVDGNTKVVEFYALIMVVKKSNLSKEVALYFSNSEGTTKSYQSSPILINAKQNKLYKMISTLVEE